MACTWWCVFDWYRMSSSLQTMGLYQMDRTTAKPVAATLKAAYLPYYNMDGVLTDVENESRIMPDTFELMQNYPNPFNPTTNISWQSAVGSWQSLKVLDVLILIFYVVTILVIAFYSSRKKEKDFSGYFLSGKNVGWIAIGMSIFATNISSEHFIGLAGSGATRGLAVAQFELMAIFILILLGWVIDPIYLKSGVTTVPELFEKRFDSRSRKFLAGLSIGIYFLTKITVTLLAGGILFYKMFGLSIYTFAILIILVTGVYTIIGGATAVLKTQVVQAFILIFGAVLL